MNIASVGSSAITLKSGKHSCGCVTTDGWMINDYYNELFFSKYKTQKLWLDSLPKKPNLFLDERYLKFINKNEFQEYLKFVNSPPGQLYEYNYYSHIDYKRKIFYTSKSHPINDVMDNSYSINDLQVMRDEIKRLVEAIKYVEQHYKWKLVFLACNCPYEYHHSDLDFIINEAITPSIDSYIDNSDRYLKNTYNFFKENYGSSIDLLIEEKVLLYV
jgi:hypothetical protein